MGFVDRTYHRRIILLPVKRRERATLLQMLRRLVKEKSILYSDGWRVYSSAGSCFYEHKVVNHTKILLILLQKYIQIPSKPTESL